jgi:hypothetical protein
MPKAGRRLYETVKDRQHLKRGGAAELTEQVGNAQT